MTAARPSLIDRVFVPASSRASLSGPVVGITAAVSAVMHLLGSPQLGNEHLTYRALVACVAVLPIFALIWLVHQLPLRRRAARTAVILASYAIGGGLRGVALSLLLGDVGLTSPTEWLFRIPSSMILMGSTVGIATYGWHTWTEHQDALHELRSETSRLQAALEQLATDSKTEASFQIAQVSADIVRELEQIELRPKANQVVEIQRVIDEQVRPLTRDLAAGIREWSPEPVEVQRVPFTEQWASAEPLRHLPSPWIASIIILAPIPSAVAWFGWAEALKIVLLTLPALLLSMRIGFALVRRFAAPLRTPLREIAITLAFVVTMLPPLAASHLALRETTNPNAYLLSGIVGFPLFAWMVTVGGAFWGQTRIEEQHLRNVRAELNWAIARINLLSWFNLGVITRLLHGPIQNSLHATVIRLRDAAPETIVNAVIGELRQTIAAVDPRTGAWGDDDVTLQRRLEQIGDVWSGIAEISVELPAATSLQLRKDRPASAILVDLALEVCSNAIRHGGASAVALHMAAAERTVTLRVHDNGHERSANTGVGVGTKFLDTCSIDWHYARAADTNRLTIVIPCIA